MMYRIQPSAETTGQLFDHFHETGFDEQTPTMANLVAVLLNALPGTLSLAHQRACEDEFESSCMQSCMCDKDTCAHKYALQSSVFSKQPAR